MYDETRESYFTSLRTPVLPPNLIISSISNYCNKITTATAIKNIAYLQNISYNHFFPAVHQDQAIKCKLNIHESHLLTLLKKIQLNVFKLDNLVLLLWTFSSHTLFMLLILYFIFSKSLQRQLVTPERDSVEQRRYKLMHMVTEIFRKGLDTSFPLLKDSKQQNHFYKEFWLFFIFPVSLLHISGCKLNAKYRNEQKFVTISLYTVNLNSILFCSY